MDDGGGRHVKLLHDYVRRVYSLITAHRVWSEQRRDDEHSFHLHTARGTDDAATPFAQDTTRWSVWVALHVPDDCIRPVEQWTICLCDTNDDTNNDRTAPPSSADLAKLHKQCVASLRSVLAACYALPAFHWYKACARTRGSSHHLQVTTQAGTNASQLPAAVGALNKHTTIASFTAGAHRVQIDVTYTTVYPSPPTCTAPLVQVAASTLQCDDVHRFLQLCSSPPPLDILHRAPSRSNATVSAAGSTTTRLLGSRHGAAETE